MPCHIDHGFYLCGAAQFVLLPQMQALIRFVVSNSIPQLCNKIKTGNSVHIQQEKRLRQVRFACTSHSLEPFVTQLMPHFVLPLLLLDVTDGLLCQSPWKVASVPLFGPSEIKRYDFWSGGRELVALQEKQDRAAVMNENQGLQADSMPSGPSTNRVLKTGCVQMVVSAAVLLALMSFVLGRILICV